MNARLAKYFNRGNIKEAILGDGEYLTTFHRFYTEHDIGFVLDQLMEWGELVGKEKEAAEAIENTLPLFFEREDKVFAVRSIWCVISSQRNFGIGKKIIIDMSKLGKTLLEFCMQNPDLINQNQEIRGMIIRICQHEPEIAQILGMNPETISKESHKIVNGEIEAK